jgi:hypothetical protein
MTTEIILFTCVWSLCVEGGIPATTSFLMLGGSLPRPKPYGSNRRRHTNKPRQQRANGWKNVAALWEREPRHSLPGGTG